jgi:hypothetical protein
MDLPDSDKEYCAIVSVVQIVKGQKRRGGTIISLSVRSIAVLPMPGWSSGFQLDSFDSCCDKFDYCF